MQEDATDLFINYSMPVFLLKKMVGSVINEIEALKEVNQFVWMSLGDLHDIADEMELPTSVQTHLKIEDRAYRAEVRLR